MTPAELWEGSGRWDVYGDELMRSHHDRQFALGPTRGETFTTSLEMRAQGKAASCNALSDSR